MIEIKFSGETWSVLRDQIQEFAVSHLHAKFGSLQLSNGQVGGAVVGGHSDAAIPEKEPAPKSEPIPARGKKSAAKDLPSIPQDVVRAAEKEIAKTEAAAPSPSHTLDECTAALQTVWDKHGMEKSVDTLAAFGAKRARELKPEQYADFIARCKVAAQ